MPTQPPPPTPQSVLRNLEIRILIDGKKCINGKFYGCQLNGQVEEAKSIYDVVRFCADHAEENNKEMEIPMAICIMIKPPNIVLKGGQA